MKGGMFANTLYTQFRVDWSWGEIYVPEIKEGVIKSLKPWQPGKEAGKLRSFFPAPVRFHRELVAAGKGVMKQKKGSRFNFGKLGKKIVPLAAMEKL